MKKIIAKEVAPDYVDFSIYFDDDGLKSESGENCACYIIPADRRRNSGFNMDEYADIEKKAAAILEGFEEVGKYIDGYKTHKEVMENYGIVYTSAKCHALKEWAKTASNLDTDDIAEFLSITTGETWNTRAAHGYSQGDYCELVYCTAHYTEDHISEIGAFWLGCGSEFIIDDCSGYFVRDTIRWTENETLVNALAEMSGYKPEELEVYLYSGEHKVADYKLLTA
jgi:hypothetical protein